MIIDDTLLSRLEKLAMIHINEDKRQKIQGELTEILGFVENISQLDIPSHCFDEELKTPMREDSPKDACVAKDVLASAPNAQDGFFIVPKIIE
ncbi:Asp-tRNA(Asn)/Glu-tRNA(Gln) amidotransferase subunit GatC [Helicobacter sp. MIT 05-5293]|uniref:Aspartyl/glutamyl-tRNA(Asn/Gln) amidotransferase subunit C n=1 Tax=uncultured Helicobacter sp. TaxID=175537 RepID=A0A650ELD0_9HELI|nr:Asp-tRNA(Asn)/Glu-tRNA(Gln) amidotransferase subunit GatC [Helicobacter sp. MIT 05-5293]QGT50242.1 glutamyl-tRNA(Gln) amidotransferase subunit C [uncultured Helicobacter sp.]TLD80804.1 Asp-tRNA(Asn)/Glu-tRNA(Gln) amidotransferase subunit GatC [Helicobacter sp. MIT 05-5293]